MKRCLVAFLASVFLIHSAAPRATADEVSPEARKAADLGLKWLAKNQSSQGHWDANGNHYAGAMTGLAGLAILMEGSTLRDGKYAPQIRKAVDWYIETTGRNGLLGNNNNHGYIYGHGYGLLFLSQVYGEGEDDARHKKLHDLLVKAVEFSGKAQTTRGGWGYVSAADQGSGGFDEGSTTITQLQALRAARNSGIPVPKSVIENAQKYLKDATLDNGALKYSLAQGGGQGGPALVAAAIAGGHSTGDYNSPLIKKWFKYCKTAIPIGQINRFGHDEYTHFYYSQSVYSLGDTGWNKLFPDDKDAVTWTKYKNAMYPHLIKSQATDGSWRGGGGIGVVFSTAVYCCILQLDAGALPIFQR